MAGGGTPADSLAGVCEHLEGERAAVKWVGGGACLFPVRGGSSSSCLHWMRIGIEQNGRGLAAAQLCRRARGSGR
jgi:hypothetical protein